MLGKALAEFGRVLDPDRGEIEEDLRHRTRRSARRSGRSRPARRPCRWTPWWPGCRRPRDRRANPRASRPSPRAARPWPGCGSRPARRSLPSRVARPWDSPCAPFQSNRSSASPWRSSPFPRALDGTGHPVTQSIASLVARALRPVKQTQQPFAGNRLWLMIARTSGRT